MFNFVNFRKNLILFSFSISIFFSYVNFFFIELRFIFLISLVFILIDKKFSYNLFKVSFLIFILLLFHVVLNNLFFNYSNLSNYLFINFFSLKIFFQILIISFSTYLIYHFRKILLLNLIKIFDLFVILFVILIFIYNLANFGVIFDTLYTCDLGFFYFTRFIYFENSHFSIIAIPVILNFIYNINYYFRNKILFFLNIIFIIFTFGNFGLTLYISSLITLPLILVSYKDLEKLRIFLLLIFLLLSNIFLFYEKQIIQFLSYDKKNLCISNLTSLEDKYQINKSRELFKGKVLEPKDKLKSLFEKEIKNLSVGIQVYSFYVAKNALIKNPFGYGISNYVLYRQIVDGELKTNGSLIKEKIVFDEFYMPKINANVLKFNLNSGSNNFSKIIVEFGVFGIVMIVLVFITFFSRKISNEVKFLLFPLIFNQLFVRGTGYFNSGFLIVSIILIVLIFEKILKNEK